MATYQAYCHECDKNWSNSSPNCPHCGAPNHDAERVTDNRRGRKKKTKPMNDEENTSTFAKAATEAIKQGALQASAKEANQLIKAGVMKGLVAAGASEEALEGALFQKGVPLMSATLLLFLAERFPDLIPKSEYVARAAQLALTSASADTLEPLLASAAPLMLQLASAGEKIAELEGDIYEDEDEIEIEVEDEDEYTDAEFAETTIEVTAHEPEAKRAAPRGVSPDQASRHRS